MQSLQEVASLLSEGCDQPSALQHALISSLTMPVTLEPQSSARDDVVAERNAWARLVGEHCVGE